MSSKTPIVKQVAWISLVPQLSFMALLILVYFLAGSGNPFIPGALTYLAISFILRTIIPKDHRQGMEGVMEERFQDAIAAFQKSYAFFSRHSWIDRFRYLTLLSSSAISYREMALCNIEFCYSQLGDGKAAVAYYTRTLEEFPDSGIAQTALRGAQSFEGMNKAAQ